MKKDISQFLLFIIFTCLNRDNQAEDIKQKNQSNYELEYQYSKKTIAKKITKQDDTPKFFAMETYADIQTCYINRPQLQTKKEFFTPAKYKKPNYYNAPNMNDWASENPSVRTCDIGTITTANKSFPLTSSCRAFKDPFKKPLPGPR